MKYPAGAEIDNLALRIKERVTMPLPLKNEDSFNFSFSGLKTAALKYKGRFLMKYWLPLSWKQWSTTVRSHRKGTQEVSLSTCGGWRSVCLQVSASENARTFWRTCYIPSAQLSTDNADMVAVYAALLLQEGIVPGSCVTPDPNMEQGWC